ncbi:MAG: NAD(P)H-dependent oxidoreductase subunit E [Thermoanaerobacterales bacterium]|nr:NAD(P)H-dependent oxidoreductase subunit E [Bacillota bacterium]MDI6905898.1 NAD(P)H-dependent oxidoreductase subunit E [Thermoanaerobacterales bacterium]
MAEGKRGKASPAEMRYRALDKFIERYGSRPGGLVRVLQKAQDLFGYLTPEVQVYVADRMCLPIGHVNGVATFYAGFVTAPRGRYTISVCRGTACYVKGAQDIFERFKELLGVDDDGTTADGLFTLRSTRCLGACGLSPVITVNEDVHGNLTADMITPLLDRYRREAEEGEREGVVTDVPHQPDRPGRDPRATPPPY